PVGRRDLLEERGRAGDPGVVHEHVEASTRPEDGVDPALEGLPVGDVHHAGVQPLGGGALDGRRIDVADVHLAPLRSEGPGDGAAEPARGGGDGDALAHPAIIPVAARPATTRVIRGRSALSAKPARGNETRSRSAPSIRSLRMSAAWSGPGTPAAATISRSPPM